jgi:heme/copper-type cytochrome/quinol oxidase subunit 3
MTTGLHALHVIVGVLFLAVGLIRIFRDSLTTSHHLGLELSIFYWHLVDVVWLLVFLIYYLWCSPLVGKNL